MRLALALVVVLLTAGCTGRSGTTVTPSGDLPNIGGEAGGVFAVSQRKLAPVLSGTTLDGTPLSTAAFRGQVVVVNFWAHWCGPCRGETRALNDAYAATRAQGVQFIGVNIKDELSPAQAFEKNKGVQYPSLFDQSGSLLLKFRGQAPQSPPTTLVFDRQGRVAARFLTPVTELQLEKPVEAIAAESA